MIELVEYSPNCSLYSNGISEQSSSVDTIESLSSGTDISVLEAPASPTDSNARCRIIHLNPTYMLYGCCECEENFLAPRILERHLRDAHPWLRFTFVCPDCGQRLLHSGHVLRHRRERHEEQRTHVCKLCDKRFKRAEHLRVHERSSHARARDFACATCGRAFARREHLHRHQRLVHRSQSDLTCGGCSKLFGRKATLTRHRKFCRGTTEVPRVQEEQVLQVAELEVDPDSVMLDCEEDDWIKLLLLH